MFKVVLDIDGDQFDPPRAKDLRLIGSLPFPLIKGTEIAPALQAMEGASFYVQAYDPEWRIENGAEGYFHSQASLEGRATPEDIQEAFHSRGWMVEDGFDN